MSGMKSSAQNGECKMFRSKTSVGMTFDLLTWAPISLANTTMCDLFFFQAEDGIRDYKVTGVQTCALPIYTFPTPGHTPRAMNKPHEKWSTRTWRSRPREGRNAWSSAIRETARPKVPGGCCDQQSASRGCGAPGGCGPSLQAALRARTCLAVQGNG